MGNLHEECGVFGIYVTPGDDIQPAYTAFNALFALQHRGQESCGITVSDKGVFHQHKNMGLASEVFTAEDLDALQGQIAIAHCRYAPNGTKTRENAQPLVVQHLKGNLAIAQNGSIVNAAQLRHDLEETGAIFQTKTDAEIIAYLIVRQRMQSESIESAVQHLMDVATGAYAMVIMSPRKLIAARDPNGYRPLCIGKLNNSYVFASESCALDTIGATFLRDVEPGEICIVEDGRFRSIKSSVQAKHALCVFEYIYFARPDSVIDGMGVDLFRRMAGACLAKEHPVEADVVIGVPDSGLPAAIGYAQESGIPFGMGLIKNRYIARTFIQPTQGQRERAVRLKLNAISEIVKGKRVVMIDDSIVRGTTCAHIVSLLRDAGATEVHMRISSPPFLFPCYFGTDVPDKSMLIAHGRTVEEIREMIGVDTLGYLSLDSVHEIAKNVHIDICDGCFTGQYATEIPDSQEISKYERMIEEC